MKYSIAVSMAAVAVGVQAQGIPAGSKVPSVPPPAGCLTTAPGSYQITVVKPSAPAKRSLEKRVTCDAASDALIITLTNGILTDSKGRIGGIVDNRQFQFDGPPSQTGTLYNGGFSVCGNTSLAIGGSTEFYQCLSGGFYNLYDQSIAAQCSVVNLNTLKCDDAGSASAPASAPASSATVASASQAADGQAQASSATSVIIQQTDGQPTAAAATTVISQISDGQIQGPTSPAGAVVTQISDGQVQATSASNATITSAQPTAPIATGGAAAAVAGSGAVVGAVAIAALFL